MVIERSDKVCCLRDQTDQRSHFAILLLLFLHQSRSPEAEKRMDNWTSGIMEIKLSTKSKLK